MRLIDADALDTLLKDAQTVCKRNRDNFRFGVLNNIRENIAIMPTVGGWISVKDRLPNNSQPEEYIVVNSGKVQLDIYLDGMWITPHMVKQITHWMPLPELPKEYQNEP